MDEDVDGGADCFIKASDTPQSTADNTRQSSSSSSSMVTCLCSICNTEYWHLYGAASKICMENALSLHLVPQGQSPGNFIDSGLNSHIIFIYWRWAQKNMAHVRLLGIFSRFQHKITPLGICIDTDLALKKFWLLFPSCAWLSFEATLLKYHKYCLIFWTIINSTR